jgi:sugar/nucleoside kinase (ribokinase family)
MNVGIIGPICRDLNIVGGKQYSRPGGVTYYAGAALARLGVETVVFGTLGDEPTDWLADFPPKVVHLPAAGTIQFINEYPEGNPDARKQQARIFDNTIRPADIPEAALAGLDIIVLGPLLHDHITAELVEFLAERATLVLAAQGMIRYLEKEKIVWQYPERVGKILPYIEYLFLDDLELAFISQREDIKDGARFLQDKGVKNVMVTRGHLGSHIFLGEEDYHIRYYRPQELADPTGAGDTYMAGYLRALELTDDPVERGEFAAMTATMGIERFGPFAGTLEEVRKRLGRESLR